MVFSPGDRQQLVQIQKQIEEQMKRGMANPSEEEETEDDLGGRDDNQKSRPLLDSSRLNFLFYPRHGQWGLLPPHLQQTIENASRNEVPLHYRRWLVEYHRQNQDDADDQ